MTDDFYKQLHADGLLSDESLASTTRELGAPLFHVHWEVKSLLYVGVLLLTGGLGLMVYENIDSIGHVAVLSLIAIICAGSFVYCIKNNPPYSTGRVKAPNTYFDYILLLACVSFLSFTGYLQFQYHVFGTNYGMATFIPMLVLFFVAYYFDHLGILAMAIANLAVWLGVSVTPRQLLLNSDFDSQTIIYTYLLLGVLLIVAAFATQRLNFKRHFKFSYQHYGVHVTYIALLAGYFHYYDTMVSALWMMGILVLSLLLYKDSIEHKAFYFLLLMVLYSYFALSSLITRLLIAVPNGGGIFLILIYFIGSATGLIFLLIHFNKKLKEI